MICDGCGQEFSVPPAYAGRVRCRKCGRVEVVNQPLAASQPAPREATPRWLWALSCIVGWQVTKQIIEAQSPLASFEWPLLCAAGVLSILGFCAAWFYRSLVGRLLLAASMTSVVVTLGSVAGRDAAIQRASREPPAPVGSWSTPRLGPFKDLQFVWMQQWLGFSSDGSHSCVVAFFDEGGREVSRTSRRGTWTRTAGTIRVHIDYVEGTRVDLRGDWEYSLEWPGRGHLKLTCILAPPQAKEGEGLVSVYEPK